MIDYARRRRHLIYRRIAEWVRIVAVLLLVPEVASVVAYHFLLWDDIAIPTTLAFHQIGALVQRRTAMYE